MSESMPIMANSAAGEQLKSMAGQAETAAGTAAGSATGAFGNLLDAQLQVAEENPSAFPAELLSTTDDAELLTAVPASGNDLPLIATTPGAAVIASPELFASQAQSPTQLQPGAAAALPISAQETAVKSVQAANVGGKLNSVANADKAVDMDELLMARQQQNLMQTAAGSKDSALFDSALNQQPASEPGSPSNAASSLNNMMNVASLSAGLGAKAESMPGLTPAPLNVPPQHSGWNQSVGERLQWMVGQNLQSADIRLDPPELGSMEVRIQIHKDHASIVFSAPNPQVREALESAIPRLREMMNDIGLSLGDVNVSQESFTQQQQAETENAGIAGVTHAGDESDSDTLDALAATIPRQGQGLLDAYA